MHTASSLNQVKIMPERLNFEVEYGGRPGPGLYLAGIVKRRPVSVLGTPEVLEKKLLNKYLIITNESSLLLYVSISTCARLLTVLYVS